MSKEAWKDSGNCKDCRRAKYCRKPCTANERRAKEKAEQAARDANGKTVYVPRDMSFSVWKKWQQAGAPPNVADWMKSH